MLLYILVYKLSLAISLGKGKLALLAILAVMILVGTFSYLHVYKWISPKAPERTETAPSIPIDVKLRLSNAPRLGETAELRCLVTCVYNASDVGVNITLPDGFVLLEGAKSWAGDIPSGGTIELVAIIKAVKVGNWTIEATAGYYLTKDSWYGDVDRIYVSVSKDSAYISETPFSTSTEC